MAYLFTVFACLSVIVYICLSVCLFVCCGNAEASKRVLVSCIGLCVYHINFKNAKEAAIALVHRLVPKNYSGQQI